MKSRQQQQSGMPWHLWGCMAIAFLIPFAKKFVPGFIGLLGIYVIVYAIKRKRLHIPSFNTPLLLLVSIFILHVVGLLWSDHVHEGMNEIGIKLSYAALPVIAWLMPPLFDKRSNAIMNSFLYGCLAFIPLAIGYGIYRSVIHHDIAWLTYQQLGIYLHPTYAAAYMSFALLILWKNEIDGKRPWNTPTLTYVFAALIIIFISMLASKAGFIAALISIFLGGYYTFLRRKTWREVLVVAVPALFLLAISAFLSPGSITRVEAAIHDIETESVAEPTGEFIHVEAKSSTALRMVSWKASSQVLIENPIGAGTGETQYTLNEKYLAADETYAAEKKLNAHNQFLQSGAEHGWLGISLLAALMITLLTRVYHKKNLLLTAFTLICGMNFLFESFLEVQAGIVFFCFMIIVFVKQEH